MVIYTTILTEDEVFKFSALNLEDGTYDMPSLTIFGSCGRKEYIDNPLWLYSLYTTLLNNNSEPVIQEFYDSCHEVRLQMPNVLDAVFEVLETAVKLKLLTEQQ